MKQRIYIYCKLEIKRREQKMNNLRSKNNMMQCSVNFKEDNESSFACGSQSNSQLFRLFSALLECGLTDTCQDRLSWLQMKLRSLSLAPWNRPISSAAPSFRPTTSLA